MDTYNKALTNRQGIRAVKLALSLTVMLSTVLGLALTAVHSASAHASVSTEAVQEKGVANPTDSNRLGGDGSITDSLGAWHRIPDYHRSAYAILDTWNNGYASTYVAGRVSVNFSGTGLYISAKGVTIAGLDGDWFRLTSNLNGNGDYSWHHTFLLPYNGMKFRICKDISFLPDTCGSTVTIYN